MWIYWKGDNKNSLSHQIDTDLETFKRSPYENMPLCWRQYSFGHLYPKRLLIFEGVSPRGYCDACMKIVTAIQENSFVDNKIRKVTPFPVCPAGGKVSYLTEDDANKAATRWILYRKGELVHVYKCRNCEYYHTGRFESETRPRQNRMGVSTQTGK